MATEIQADAAPTISQGRVAKNASIYLLAQIVSWFVTFAALSIIPRTLGKAGSGQLAIVQNAFVFSPFLMLGIDQYLAKELGRDRRQSERLLRGVMGLRLAMLPVIFASSLFTLWLMRPSQTLWILGLLFMASGIPGLFAERMRSEE